MDKPPIDRNNLSDLYPQAKTYDQLESERMAGRGLHQARQPQYMLLKISLGMAVIPTLLFLVVNNPQAFMIGNIISGVFFAFLQALLVVGYAWLQLRQAQEYCYRHDRTFAPILARWVAVLVLAIVLLVYSPAVLTPFHPLIFAAVAFASLYGLLRRIPRES